MKKNLYSRREFVKQNSLAGIGAAFSMSMPPAFLAVNAGETSVPAIMGGNPVRNQPWPVWPLWKPGEDEDQLLSSIRSGVWSRANIVDEFEKKWAETVGSKRCLATVNGTNALIAALAQYDIGGGDEVIIPPYTFIATAQAVLMTGAMPVFADTDPETFQMDPEGIEAKITPRTRAILPVHILGLPSDMVRIMEIAKKHNLVVIEDACQSWLAEIGHKQTGTFGDAGCYSFQNSKNIPIGEAGAIVSDDEEFMDRCHSYHNYGNPFGTTVGDVGAGTVMLGTKLRITEYQAAIGLAQIKRLGEQTDKRWENGEYLKSRIGRIPGIIPYKLYPNVTKAAFHLFPFRYKKEEFKGLSRADFMRAMSAEGVPCMGGYRPLNKMAYLAHAFNTKNFKRMYSAEMLDYKKYMEQNQCHRNDQLCEEAVWLFHNILLAEKRDMDDIFNAIEKIHLNAEKIKNRT